MPRPFLSCRVAQSSVPGYEVILWHGIVAPKGVPAPIVARLDREVNAILATKEAASLLEREGVAPAGRRRSACKRSSPTR